MSLKPEFKKYFSLERSKIKTIPSTNFNPGMSETISPKEADKQKLTASKFGRKASYSSFYIASKSEKFNLELTFFNSIYGFP